MNDSTSWLVEQYREAWLAIEDMPSYADDSETEGIVASPEFKRLMEIDTELRQRNNTHKGYIRFPGGARR